MSIFEIATRAKVRFQHKGLITVEDLWELKLEDLDSIFKELNKSAKQLAEESLLSKKSNEDHILTVKIEIIKHIVESKQQEAYQNEMMLKLSQEQDKLVSILTAKKDADLGNLSVEELEERIKKIQKGLH